MKKSILSLAAAAFLLASCGGSSEKENENKVDENSINAEIENLTKTADDYCVCLETKSIEECNNIHLKLNKEFDQIMAHIDELPKNGVKDPQVMEELRNKAIPLFDKKAACAKAKMGM